MLHHRDQQICIEAGQAFFFTERDQALPLRESQLAAVERFFGEDAEIRIDRWI